MAYRNERKLHEATSILDDHHRIYVERYQRLKGWAMSITGEHAADAEDLLHEVFVQFLATRPDLSAIGNIDGYLRRTMKYIYSTIRYRRDAREAALDLAECDSAAIGLRAACPQARLIARETLMRICRYACLRKESSRLGSVLILRFFHDYAPIEIARVVGSPRGTVDQMIKRARNEARSYLDDPQRLVFMNGARQIDQIGIDASRPLNSPAELMEEMRAVIFRARSGDCLSPFDLRRIYMAGNDDQYGKPDVPALAHLVGCHGCLDEVNRLLGLPALAERYWNEPPDSDADDSNDPGNAAGAGDGNDPSNDEGEPTRAFIARAEAAARRLIEHRPEELHFYGSGKPIGAIKPASALTEVDFAVRSLEPIDFIQVRNEHGRLMFLFEAADPDLPGSPRQIGIPLSDERRLDLRYERSDIQSILTVRYYDPLLAAEPEAASETENREAPPVLTAIRNEIDPLPAVRPREELFRSFQADNSLFSLFRWRPWAFAIAIALMVAGALLFGALRTPSVSGAELLRRATTAEEALLRTVGQDGRITHRSLRIEERLMQTGRAVSSHQVEIWHDPARGVRARRIYDEKKSLTAGEWTQADGRQIFYRRGSVPRPEPVSNYPASFDDLRLYEPSPAAFRHLIGAAEPGDAGTRADTRLDAYIVSWQSGSRKSSTMTGLRILKAALTLRKEDMRATEMTLTVAVNSDPGELREFRFVESGFEQPRADAIPPRVFEPEADLFGLWRRQVAPEPIAPAPPESMPAPPAETPLRPGEIAALKIGILHRLDQVGAIADGAVDVTITPEGFVMVEGLLRSDERKETILRALQPAAGHPAVRMKIGTVDELAALEQPPPRIVRMEETQPVSNRIAVHRELYAYIASRQRPDTPDTDDSRIGKELISYANRVSGHAEKAMGYAWALKRLSQGFSLEQLRELTPEARSEWLAMIGGHARRYARVVESLRGDLDPLFFKNETGMGEKIEIKDETQLLQAIDRLWTISSMQQQAVRLAFSLSDEAVKDVEVKSPRFRRLLLEAEALAAQLQATTFRP